MSSKAYRLNEKFLGIFGDGAEPPAGAVECDPPEHGADTWNGAAWDTSTRPQPPADPVLDALEIVAAELPQGTRDAVLSKVTQARAKQ